MKLSQRLTRRLFSLSFSPSSSPSALRNVSGLAAAWLATEKPRALMREKGSSDTLYRRISQAGGEASIMPVLDGWVNEGRYVNRNLLLSTIKGLRKYRRCKHALEVFLWMSNRRSMALSAGDIAVQLDLISKVHGSEQVEKHFNQLPTELRNHQTYCALLNCYTHEMLVDKAEALFLMMRNLGISRTALCYNVMSSLYYKIGNRVKLDNLVQEMEREGIMPDKVMYGILICAYGNESDIEGIKKMIAKAESDHGYDLGSYFYITAANSYFRAGHIDIGVECLRKAEKLITVENKKDNTLNYLLSLYAVAGRKEEVLRIWKRCKKYKLYNRDYICMISSLLKLNEFDAAEQILEEWESTNLSRDTHLPNLLIHKYCIEGLLEKAEGILNRLESKGIQPNSFTRFYFAQAFIHKKQMPEAVEAMKSAMLTNTFKWKPTIESLAACLNYLIAEQDIQTFEELAGLLRSKGYISEELQHKLLVLALNGNEVEDAMKEDFASGSVESPKEHM